LIMDESCVGCKYYKVIFNEYVGTVGGRMNYIFPSRVQETFTTKDEASNWCLLQKVIVDTHGECKKKEER